MDIMFYSLCILIYLSSNVNCLMFQLPANAKKCLKDEMKKGEVVSGEFDLSDVPGQKTDLIIVDTKGHVLLNREDINKGKFAFNSDEYDVYELCFVSKLPTGQRGMPQEVTLSIKKGTEAKNYDQLAEVGKLKPLEVELDRLEDLSQAIVADFAHMRKREEAMRDTNESTNSRVLYLSIFSMCCLLSLATWQVLYLRRFFKAKKLIE